MVLPIGPWGGGAATFYQITNSLLFRGGQKLYRSFTSSSTWGLSVWVRRNALGAVNPIFGSAVKFNASDTLTAGSLTTTAVYRDPTAWMHIAIAGGHLWVNGVDMGATTTSAFTCSATNCLGYDGTNYLRAEIAEFAFADGSQPAYAPGRTDGTTGSWAPNPVSATWGTNGSYLGKPWNAASLGTDYSGQGNNWTATGFSASDVVTDSPTNVFATLSPLNYSAGAKNLSNGNLTANPANAGHVVSTLAMTTGVYKAQVKIDTFTTPGTDPYVGVCLVREVNNTSPWLSSIGVNINGNESPFFASSDVLDLIYFADTGTLQIYKNNNDTPVLNQTNASLAGMPVVFHHANSISSGGCAITWTFDQSKWAYATRSNAKPLCTASLPATIGVTSGSFTGNASADGTCVYTGAPPETMTINGNPVIWGTHADKLATGFKLRTSSASYNSTSTNNWTATYSTPQKPTVGSNKVPSNAQGNP